MNQPDYALLKQYLKDANECLRNSKRCSDGGRDRAAAAYLKDATAYLRDFIAACPKPPAKKGRVTIYAKIGTHAAHVVQALHLKEPLQPGTRFEIRELSPGAKPEPVLCREIKVLPDGHEGTPLYFLERF